MDIKTVLVSVAAATAASAVVAPMAATFVTLQASSPGTVETGHTNISGNAIAGRVGAGTSPTLARVQVAELGSLQGVRANTSSGVSVFGANSAASGLGAGGYFTSASVGGRAMVAEQLSTTGNTVGGLFYNRSTTGGVALWGKHIGTSGTTTGVYGEVASTGGAAIAALNTASNNKVELGTGNDSLLAHGAFPRYEYVANTPAAMVPIAYGVVASGGGVYFAGSGNWACVKTSTGTYEITVSGITTGSDYCLTATAIQNAGNEFAAIGDQPTTPRVLIWNVGSAALTDSAFSFILYRRSGSVTPMMPEPPELKKYGIEGWEKRQPREFEAWRKKFVAWQMEQGQTKGHTRPPTP